MPSLGARITARYDAIRRCHERGGLLKDAATEAGVSYQVASVAARRLGLKFPHAGRIYNDPRADSMATLYRSGRTLQQIGNQYGLTRERVRQIIGFYHGLDRKDGGVRITSEKNKAARGRKAEMRSFARWGCSVAQHRALLKIGREMRRSGKGAYQGPCAAFRNQKNNAASRGIAWELTLWQWWQIWQESGRWEQRGRGQGYVMRRLRDEGPYAPGNVFIASAIENCSDTPKKKKSGLPCGVSLKIKGAYQVYCASRMINGEKIYLGSFPTPEQAHAAYLAAPLGVAT